MNVSNLLFNPRKFVCDLYLEKVSFSDIVVCLYIEFSDICPGDYTIFDCINLCKLYIKDFKEGWEGCDI